MWGMGEFGLEVLNGSGNPEEQPPQAEVKLLEQSLEWEHALVGMLGVGDLLGDLLGANLADMRRAKSKLLSEGVAREVEMNGNVCVAYRPF